MRVAVFKKGFNPFALGLVPSPLPIDVVFKSWKNTIVAQDTADWNICPKCMITLAQYLEDIPKPTGIKESKVCLDPQVGAMAAKKIEEKYQQEEPKKQQYTTVESKITPESKMSENQVTCSCCGKPMPNSLQYCSNCGKKLEDRIKTQNAHTISTPDEGKVSCSGCGKVLPITIGYCDNCGKKLDKAKQQIARIDDSSYSQAKEVTNEKSPGYETSVPTSADTAACEEKGDTGKITCADCNHSFVWNDAYQEQETQGSFLHNPPGHGNYRPRAFCPNCGFLIAEWDIDRQEDRGRWKWHGENATVNKSRELPPHPLGIWGQHIKSDARVTVREDHIDVKLLKSIPTKATETIAEKLLPEQIIANTHKELDNAFRSRLKFFDRSKKAFETLKLYVEGQGKADSKAIALLGLIEFYSNKRNVAREMFTRALSIDESCALAYLGLGILDYQDAHFPTRYPNAAIDGLKRLDDAIKLDPQLVDAYTWKARIQKHGLNDSQGAWNTLQQAIAALGEDGIKQNALGYYLFVLLGELCVFDYKGKVDNALHYFEMALATNPNQYQAPMHLMHMYQALGRQADAARVQLAYEKTDQGIGLTNEAIDSIHRFVASERGNFIGQKYEVIKEVGHGGFGIVYLVYSHETKEAYAFKTFKDEYRTDAETRELFRKEANTWIELERHPYLVQAYFVDEVEGRLYIGMEYIAPNEAGLNSLEGYLRNQPAGLPQSLKWAIQFCYGMEYAYSKGIQCHRDIKPENILITVDKTVKITDFGIAGAFDSNMEGVSLGTRTHMPPEQFINAKSCDQRSDIYSFGIVLYQMATNGKLPFLTALPKDGSSEEQTRFHREMFRLHSQAQVPPLNSPLFPVIQRCLEKEPQKRYQTFGELRADLEPLLKQETGETVQLPTVTELAAWEWNNKGTSLEKMGRFEEAIQCYDKALEMNPNQPETWFNKGNSLGSLHRLDEAIKCHDKAIEINPNHPMGWNNKGAVLHELGRFDEAIQCHDKALEINPQDIDAWNNKAVSLAGLGRFEEAIRCCDKALEINPNKLFAWINKGTSLRRLGRFHESIQCHDRALEIDPRHAGAWNNKGVSLIKLGNFDQAIECYNKALEINPQYVDAWYNKGNYFIKTGHPYEAIKCYDKTLELNPQHPGAFLNRTIAQNQLNSKQRTSETTQSNEDTAEKDAERWALQLEQKEDYHALAAIFNSTDYANDKLHFKKQSFAKAALKRAGSKAADAILEETAKDGVGCINLAELLADMNETKAVPLLKKLLDRGRFNAYGSKYEIEEFANKYPELQEAAENSECALCGKTRPTAEMHGASKAFGEPLKYFCTDTCWSKRGSIVGSTFNGAKNCPFYAEGMCKVGGDNTCSLNFGSYDTTCFVYKYR